MRGAGPGRDPPLDLFRHLPAIYRRGPAADDPFSLLVRALAENHREIEAVLARVPAMLDPRTAPAGFDDRRPTPLGEERVGFLEYLAGWVALDPAMLGGRDRTLGETAPDRRTRVLRHLVEQAAPLQAARGTVEGTRYLLEVLFEAEVEILEWRWPGAFQPGVTASLGTDTLLLGEPPLDRCVTLLWDSDGLRRAIAALAARGGAGGEAGAFTLLDLAIGDRRAAAVVTRGTAEEVLGGFHPASVEQLQRLHAVLKLELPAHIVYYVGIRPPDGPEAPELLPFIVEVSSTLGHVQIQRRS